MASDSKGRRELGKRLEDKRGKHIKLLKKVEKAQAKFERRAGKLRKLEARIAELEAQYYRPEVEQLGQADAGDKNLRHARLIFNPKSGDSKGGAKLIARLVAKLRGYGIVADLGVKTSGKAARELAKEAVANGESMVIVAGGDGTIEDVASQLVGTQVALGIIPIGTMNNLARSLGVPLDQDDACALLGLGVTRGIDLGRVIGTVDKDDEYFMETSGSGLGAIVLPAGQALEKGRWDRLPKALKELIDHAPRAVSVTLDNKQVLHASTQLITVSNAPLMGDNLLVAPDAKMDDGMLDVAIYEGMNKAELLRHFLSIRDGKRAEDPKVRFYRTSHVRIESGEPLQAHSDKEPLEPQDVIEFEVVSKGLTMVVGQGVALTLPVQVVPSVPPLAGPQAASGSNGAGAESASRLTTGG